jgi:hypothetical protein
MTTIVTRAGKGSALTHNEVDANFTNLNDAKYESGNNATLGTIQGSTITATTAFSGALNGTVGATTPAAGTFTNLAYTGTLTGGTGVVNLGSGQVYKDASGNVGIGTASPASTLDVAGVIRSTISTPFFELISSSTTTGGLYSPDVNSVNLLARSGKSLVFMSGGATERMRIDTSGNVGIGTSSPAQKLMIYDASSTVGAQISCGSVNNYLQASTSAGILGTGSAHPLVFQTSSGERMRIDSSGNVGIGTSNPGQKLHLAGGNTNFVRLDDTTNGAFNLVGASSGLGLLGTYSNHPLLLVSNSLERMRIDTAGNLLVGSSTSPGGTGGFLCPNQIFLGGRTSVVSGSSSVINMNYNGGTIFGIMMQNISTTTGNALTFLNSSLSTVGAISTSSSATAYNTTSDYRLKENVAPMIGALEKVALLKPVTYTWKASGETSQGFIAHELQEVVPDCVSGEKDAVDAEGNPQYQGIDTSFLVATLTAAIQELNAKVEALEAQLQGN